MGKPIPLPFYPLLSKTSRSKIHFTGAFPHNPRMSRERCIVQYPVFFVSACFVSAFSVLAFQRTLRYYTRLSSRKNDSGFSSYSGTGFPVRTQCSPTAIAVRSTELSPRQFFSPARLVARVFTTLESPIERFVELTGFHDRQQPINHDYSPYVCCELQVSHDRLPARYRPIYTTLVSAYPDLLLSWLL